MTSSDATALLGNRVPSSPPHASRRDLLARMRPQTPPPPVRAQTPAPASAPTPLSRDRILDATEATLREHGYDGTTIRRIAGRLECAVGTIYRHFTDKRALLDAVVQRRFEPVADQVEQQADLEHTAALYLTTAAQEPQQYRLMFWLAGVDDHDRPGVPEVILRILRGWGAQLGDTRRAGRFWAQLHGALMLGLPINTAQLLGEALAASGEARDRETPGNGTVSQRVHGIEDITLL